MDFPKLKNNQCAVLFAELATGIVCKKNLARYNTTEDKAETFQIFDDFLKAKEFVLNFISVHSDFECIIYDCYGKFLAIYDCDGERR